MCANRWTNLLSRALRLAGVALLGASLAIGVAPLVRVAADEPSAAKEEAKRESEEIMTRVRELAVKQDVDGIVAVAKSVIGKWVDVDPDLGSRCLIKICAGLVGWDLSDRVRATALAQDLAFRELDRRSSPPIHIELQLVTLLRSRQDLQGEALARAEFVRLRARQVEAWIRAWLRLDAAIDPKWVRSRLGMWPHPPAGYREGTPPEDVKDPEIREAYASEWRLHLDVKKRDSEQREMRSQKEQHLDSIQRLLADAAREEPRFPPEDLRTMLRTLRDPVEVEAFLERVASEDKRQR